MKTIIKSVVLAGTPVPLGSVQLGEKPKGMHASSLTPREPQSTSTSIAQQAMAEPDLDLPMTQVYPEREIAGENPEILAERLFASRLESAVAGKLAELQDKHAQEAQERFTQASQEGYQKGYQEGLARATQDTTAEAAKQRQTLQAQFDKLCAEIESQAHSAFADTEAFVCQLAFETLCKILGDGVASGETITAVVRENIQRIKNVSECVLTLHPDDAKIVQTMYGMDRVRPLIETDQTMARGGCRIQSRRGTLDASLETQLQAFLQALRGRAASEDHPLHESDATMRTVLS